MHPVWFLFLGRKACIPAERVWLPDGLQDLPLLNALQRYPWLGKAKTPPDSLRLMIEDADGALVRNDQPLSFAPRRYLPRHITLRHTSRPQRNDEE